MDFFAAQDHARHATRRLVLWFALAVAGIIVAVYAALALSFGILGADAIGGPPPLWDPGLFAIVALCVGSLILIGSVYKVLSLSRDGGARIAEELGGRLVSRATTDTRERRLINVVEEMAIASGIPAPPVYVLDGEAGINAFAAGARPSEAVVAVTRGTLERLSRDELQGVVAHEFSHILNGDMRLNLRLLGVLHGILLLTLAGRTLLRSAGRSDKNGAPLLLVGGALAVTGYIGVLCGKLIKAGVSRQREFLADASAVQFTRNPSGIAGALARIADIGSEVVHPRAEEASHMFFGTSAKFSNLMATHPPIDERIRRIDPAFRTRQRGQQRSATQAAEGGLPPGVSGLTAAAVGAAVGTVSPQDVEAGRALIDSLPDPLTEALRRPRGARALVFALLLSGEKQTREQQLTEIDSRFGADVAGECATLSAELVRLEAGRRLPLLDIALPTLTEFAPEARAEIVDVADALIRADGRSSPFEYVTRRLLHAVLVPERDTGLPSRASPASLRRGVGALLALLARAGHDDTELARAAFSAAAAAAPLDGDWRFDDHARPPSSAELDRILADLSATQPNFRRRLVEACAAAVLHDGQVAVAEFELLRAVCQALDCPLPPLDAAG